MKSKTSTWIFFFLFLLTASGVFAAMVENSHQGSLAISITSQPGSTENAAESHQGLTCIILNPVSVGAFISKDPIGFNGGNNLYRYADNNPMLFVDPWGLTHGGEVVDNFLAVGTGEKIWVMDASDPYTRVVKHWAPVRNLIELVKLELKGDCENWKVLHSSDSNWSPQKRNPPSNAWHQHVDSPPGTDPESAKSAYWRYLRTDRKSSNPELDIAAIGSFDLYATVSNVDCCKEGTINFWMYNEMSKSSFGRFATFFPFSGQATQYMWWGWSEKVEFGSAGW